MKITKSERHIRKITLRLTPSMYAALEKLAKKSDVSIAEVIRECVGREVK